MPDMEFFSYHPISAATKAAPIGRTVLVIMLSMIHAVTAAGNKAFHHFSTLRQIFVNSPVNPIYKQL